MSTVAIAKLRTICLTLPEATEDGEGVGSPSFKVRDKIFAMHHPHNGRASMWCKAPRGFQDMVVSSDPDTFFVPPYVGKSGWIGIWLDVKLDWAHIAELVAESYRMTASKRLIKLMPQRSS